VNELFTRLGFRLLHVGVGVPALAPASESLCALFGYKVVAGPFDDPAQKVSVSFLSASEGDAVEVELIAPLGDDSPIRSMLAKNGGGAYHLCFETADMDAALAHAESNRCVVIARPVPAVAYAGRKIAWIYTPGRQLFELVEATPKE
jgi:methylmalonyl-CoA/ethylmalonyl-CoA epimerase